MFKLSISIPIKVHLACLILLTLLMPNLYAATNELPIVVIGAGSSGLSTAKTLQEAGKKVIVLEARDRVGGRVNSQQFKDYTVDLGASWIHGIDGGNPLWEIVQKNHIKTKVYNYDQSTFFHKNGKAFTDKEYQVFEKFIEKIEEELPTFPSTVSADEAIKTILNRMDLTTTLFPDKEALKQSLYGYYVYSATDPFASSLDKLSSHYMEFEGFFPGDEVVFPNGYSQVMHALAKDLDIKTNVQVKEINYNDENVDIIDQNQQHYLASKVVVTVPLGVLKKNVIQFKPELPTEYKEAIQKIGFGSFNKVFLEFDKPFPFNTKNLKNDIYFNYKGQWFNILDMSKPYQKPMYLILFGGPYAEWINTASDKEVWEFLHTGLTETFKNVPQKPKNMIVTRWGNDPYAYGSFSYSTPEFNYNVVHTLQQPIQNKVYFAGEHTSFEYSSTVHGAYLSGQDAAKKILEQK